MIWIATTGFAWYSSANDSSTGAENNTNLSQIFDNTKEVIKEKTGNKMWKRKWMSFLTDEEKTSLETMSDDEKKAFFEAKKAERSAEKEVYRAILDKLLNGESITAEEQATLEAKQAQHEAKHEGKNKSGNDDTRSMGKTVIAKLIAWETLSAEEQTVLEEMKAKRDARDAIQPLMEKKKAGTDLTDAEQEQLDVFKAEYKGKKWKKWERWKRWEKNRESEK